MLSSNEAGLNSSTYTMTEILQRIRFARGDIDIPPKLRFFCNLPEEAEPGVGKLRLLEVADLVLLEPNTTFDVFLGPYALHRAWVLEGLLNKLRNHSLELDKAIGNWWHEGIFRQNRSAQREAAEFISAQLPGKVEDEDLARAMLFEARGGEQSTRDFEDSIAEFYDIIDLPIGFVTFVYAFLADGRPIGWPADFIENSVRIATNFGLPIFDSAEIVNRYGVRTAVDERSLYRHEFRNTLASEMLGFARQVAGKAYVAPALATTKA